jgi:RHS repeat-associated protein
MLRQARAALAAFVFLLPVWSWAQTCAWFAGKDAIFQVQAGSSTPAVSLPNDGAMAIAMNGQDCGVWVLGKTHLRRYDGQGVLVHQVALSAIDQRLQLTTQIAVDPYDGSVWVAGDKILAHFSSTGVLLALPAFDGVVRSVAVGLDQNLWLLGDKQVSRFGAAGAVLPVFDLKLAASSLTNRLAVDSVGGALWASTNKDLLRLNTAQAGQAPVSVRTSNAIVAIALEPTTGRLWLAEAGALSVHDATGMLVQTVNLANLGLGSAENIAFDPAAKLLWVWTKDGVARLSIDGVKEAFIPAQYGSGLLAVPAFWVQPRLSLIEPPQDAITNNARRLISIAYDAQCNGAPCTFAPSYLAGYSLTAALNSQQVGPSFVFNPDTKQATYTPAADLPQGTNTLQAQAKDSSGRLSNSLSAQFTVDTVPPVITITSPQNGLVTNKATLAVVGNVNEQASVLVNNISVSVSPARTFTASVTLQEGANAINLVAVDQAGNTGSAQLGVTLDTQAPAVPVSGSTSVSMPSGGLVTITGAAGSVEAGSRIAVTNTKTGVTVATIAGANGSFSAQIAAAGSEVLGIVVSDQAGNQAPTLSVNVPGRLPPDPATVATAIDPTVPTQMAASTAFLYSGASPIQTGVAPGTIEARRVAVIRGKLMTRDGQPLPGVTITVLGHSEFGQTMTRTDGMFDMAVNGGGTVTINYSKAGYLPVQRSLTTPWQDYVVAPDVVMLQLDTQATAVNLIGAAAVQVARGSPVSDASGNRQATLLFAPGTAATLTLGDGTTRPLTSATVRATEYTVGPNGPLAMPGPLPASSGYTYAIEFSVDEAITAGAKEVRFSKPVISYVDNFLDFPVGSIVPAGYYDRDKAAWIAARNGKVIKVLGATGGLAEIDVTGSGAASDPAALAQLGIDDMERQELAALYPAGQSLWRAPVDHFTPWDFNWPWGPPDGAVAPPVPTPAPKSLGNPELECGSVIECQNQSLGEVIPVVGTPFNLNYRSSPSDARTISVPLTGASIPAALKRVEFKVSVAGREFSQSFSPAPSQIGTFEWDGRDAYGRPVAGTRLARVRVGYVYGLVYRRPSDFERSFAIAGAQAITGERALREVTIWSEAEVAISSAIPGTAAKSAGLGGWTLDVQHSYDPVARVLHRGDGSSNSATDVKFVISTFARGDSYSNSSALAVDAAGNLYVAIYSTVFKISPDGSKTRVTGDGYPSAPYPLDGALATQVGMRSVDGLAVDSQGAVFIADGARGRIFKIAADGRIWTVAGGGAPGFSGDGGPAMQAQLQPREIAVDQQGSLLFVDGNMGWGGQRIRKVTPDGMISTILPAAIGLTGIAVDTQGGIYTLNIVRMVKYFNGLYWQEWPDYAVRRIAPSGDIATIAGGALDPTSSSTCRFDPADGARATEVSICASGYIAVDGARNVYIGTFINDANAKVGGRILKVSPDGVIIRFAGDGKGIPRSVDSTSIPESGPATAIPIEYGHLAVDTSGAVYLAERNFFPLKIRKIAPAFPGSVVSDFVVASADQQLFGFDSVGRHVRTFSALTGADLYRFAYGTNGNLSQVTDGMGNVTRIERDADGRPLAIDAADGQRTALALDSSGFLATVTNPAGEATRLVHTEAGLLTEFRRPNGKASTFSYDSRGRLIRDENAAGGFWELTKTELGDKAYQVSMRTALGHTKTYKFEQLATGDSRRTNSEADGTISTVLNQKDGTTQRWLPDGSVVTTRSGPDPRFGMQAAFTTSQVVSLSSGLTNTVTFSREALLGAPNEPMRLVTQTEKTTFNGKTFTNTFNAALRQYTLKSPMNRTSVVKVDTQSRPLSVQVTGLEPVNYSYDSRGRVSGVAQGGGADTRTSVLAYNAQGWLASVTDPVGRSVGYEYDAAGRVTRKTLPDSRVIGFTYDANGNVASVTPPSRPSHAFTYTPVDLRQQYAPPSVNGIANTVTRYAYDLDKQLTTITRPDAQTLQFGYDTGGRLSAITAPHGVTSYGYAPTKGTLASISAPGGIGLAYTYDGFLLLSESWSGAIAGSVARTYNNDFDLKTLNVAGTIYTFGYDSDRLLTSAGAMTIGRDAGNGFIKTTQLGSIATTQSYNAFGELQQFQASQGGAALLAQTYEHDKLGRIVGKLETVQGQTDSWGYGYDLAGRLTSVSKNGAVMTAYQYDANGNRTSDGVNQASYDEQDRLLQYGGASYTYTDNGELKSQKVGSQETNYGYDVMGNLRSATLSNGKVIEYIIDGRNRRIGKKVNGALVQGLLYQDQLKPVAELDGSGVKARFVYGSNSNVPDYMEKGGKTYRVVSDHLGSVRMVVDVSTGEIAQRMDYDAFGFVIQDSNPGFQPFGFAGGILDNDTKLTRFGARDYDAFTGRWTVKDPIGFAGGDTNMMGYVNNDPLNHIDPLGLGPWDKLYGLPKEFWKWLHKEEGGELMKAYKDPKTGQIPKEDARELYEQWKRNKESGFVDPSLLGELLLPWGLTPTALAPGTLWGPGTPYPTRQDYDKAMRRCP